ncbi:MAG TPA: ATP-binding protein [Polyangiaceae bacterium]|jgi:signal transduction histidine kinase
MHVTELTDFVVSLVACGAFVALTVLAASRGKRDPLARLLALLCVNLVLYSSSEAIGVLGNHHGKPLWDWINDVTASEAPPLFYHFVVAFVGRRKALRPALIACHLFFGALAILCFSPILVRQMAWFPGGAAWAALMLAGLATILAHGVALLGRHVRGASMEEKARSRLVLAAALIAGIANMTDLADIAGATWSPRLGATGLVISAFVLAAAALRVRVFERLSFLTAVNAIAIALSVVLAEIGVFRFVGDRSALAVVLTVFVVLAALVASRFVVGDYAAARERTLAHASLGRMAAQMAHDIKNPLASIRGAAQFLAAERDAGRSIDEQHEFLELLVKQCDRLTRIVDQYHRIGRGEPVLGKTDLNEAAREAMKFLASSAKLDARFAETLPPCETDRDLLVIALENVLRNAHEAAIDRPVHVETGAASATVSGDRPWVFVSVRDEGPGMDPRTRERALEGFFTTKSQGSGLGLAFVRRVVEAHRGKLLIDSHEGRGTTVRIELRAAAN